MSESELKYLCLYDYHNTSQSNAVLKKFKNAFIDKYGKHLSLLFKVELRITISQVDLLETLHQAKHEIERFSSLYLWNHESAAELKKIKSLPKGFTTEKKGLSNGGFDTPHLF